MSKAVPWIRTYLLRNLDSEPELTPSLTISPECSHLVAPTTPNVSVFGTNNSTISSEHLRKSGMQETTPTDEITAAYAPPSQKEATSFECSEINTVCDPSRQQKSAEETIKTFWRIKIVHKSTQKRAKGVQDDAGDKHLERRTSKRNRRYH